MNFLQRTPFFRLLLPVITGILIYQYWELPLWMLLSLLIVSIICITLSFIIKSSFQHKYRWLFGCGISIFLIVLSYFLSAQNERKNEFDQLGQNGIFLVELTDNPIEKHRSYLCKVRIIEYTDSVATIPANGNAYIYFQKDSIIPTLLYGDRLFVSATFQSPNGLRNPDGFDYPAYLKRQGVVATAYVTSANWKYAGASTKFSLRYEAGKFRNHLLDIYRKFDIKGNDFAVLAALTLGYTDELNSDLREAYSKTGATHILSVSGLHVGIIYVVLTFLLGFLNKSRKQQVLKACFILLFLWMYAFITGLPPAAVRATCMFSFVAIGAAFNRNSQIYNTICMSAFFMLLIQPMFLFHIGFQLSYAAVVSIIYFYSKFSKLFDIKNKLAKWAWNLITVSVAAQIGVVPLLLFYFQTFPNYFLLTNIIVIPTVSIVLYSGIALLLFSFVPILSTAIAFILKGSLQILNFSIDTIQQLPYAISIIPINAWQAFLLTLAIITFCYYLHTKKYLPLTTALCCTLLIVSISTCIKYQTMISKKIIVYASYRNTHVNLLDANRNYVYTTDLEELNHTASAFWNNHYIKEPELINEETEKSNGLIHFGGKTILIPTTNLTNTATPLSVDYLIIGSNVKFKINELLRQINTKTIIIDGSTPDWHRIKIKNYCNEKNIYCYDTNDEGAFIINI